MTQAQKTVTDCINCNKLMINMGDYRSIAYRKTVYTINKSANAGWYVTPAKTIETFFKIPTLLLETI